MDFKADKKYRQDFWKGTSQASRLLDELKPEYVQVDEQTLYDLIQFTDRYARNLVFHRGVESVQENGDWQEFLVRDYLYLLFFMSNTRVADIRTGFIETLETAYRTHGNEQRRKKAAELFGTIVELAANINSWYENMEYNENTQDLVFMLRNIVEKELKPGLAALEAVKAGLHDKLGQKHSERLEHLKNKLKFVPPAVQTVFSGMPDEVFASLNTTFTQLFFLTNHLSMEAKKVLEKVLAERQDNKAHMALFIAFLRLYQRVQGQQNQITRKHLEFYYHRVLRQSPDDILPDLVYLCLQTAGGGMLLPSGTGFTAGKGADGKNLIYRSTGDTLLTPVQIKQMHTLFVSKNPLNFSGLNGSAVTDIFYRRNIHLPEQPPGWAPFGEEQFFKGSESRTMDDAPVGFLIASDALHLTEGDRDITIDLECTRRSYLAFKLQIREIAKSTGETESNTFVQVFASAFDFYLTLGGVETPLERFAVKDNPAKGALSVHFELASQKGPLAGPSPSKDPTALPVTKPYVKLLLKPESHIYAYPLIQTLKLANITISTAARGIRDLKLYNNFGQINPAVPFPLFGASPQIGAYFVVGSEEIFTKHLDDFTLKIKWFQLPQDENGWEDYFSAYGAGITNNDYKIALTYLKEGTWNPVHNRLQYNLFEEKRAQGYKTKQLSENTVLARIDLPKLAFRPHAPGGANPFGNKTRDGYLKLELTGPKFLFGQPEYAKKLSEVVLYNAKLKPDEGPPLPEPAPPVSPMVAQVQADYRASVSAFEDDKPTYAIDLYRITPFGYHDTELKSAYESTDLLEPYDDEGSLYIGLDAYPAGGYISLFFHLKEGRVEDFVREIPEPKWQYLAGNTWYDFDKTGLIVDSTARFIQSGIVQLQIPDAIQDGNTILDGGLFWIKVSVQAGSEVAADVNAIFVNALTAQWDGLSDNVHLDNPLPAYTIQKFKDKVSGVKTITQPVPSFGGKKVEDTHFFYQRVSERLRHKHRAVTASDYERLVLNRFPVIYHVKCFTGNTLYGETAPEEQKFIVQPGNVKIVLIPDVNSPEVRNILRPKVGISVLVRIREYLRSVASPFAEIEVINPFYERVKVIAGIKLKKGLIDEGYYINRLNEELKSYLTPWLWDKKSDDKFGDSVFESRVMDFVQNRSYVDFVSGFSIIKTWDDGGDMGMADTARTENQEELKPLYPWSILVSADQHDLTAIRKEAYIKPEPRGIDNMLMGSDFIISE